MKEMKKFEYINNVCPIGAAINAIGGKWKIAVLWGLRNGKLRFSTLHKTMPKGISASVLTNQLRELEKDDLIHREIFKEIPPRVEYSLTRKGEHFLPVIVAMGNWSENYLLG